MVDRAPTGGALPAGADGWVRVRLDLPLDDEAVRRIARVRALLVEARDAQENRATSIRLNARLREAASLAVEGGWSDSLTTLFEEGLALRLGIAADDLVEQHALDEHYATYPEAHPDLWEIVVAAARLDDNPVADHPDLIRLAVATLGEGAEIDQVLTWASGALAASAISAAERATAG